MKKRVIYLFIGFLCFFIFSSCGEYNEVLKSNDAELQYSFAKKCFNKKDYSKAATLLESLVNIYKGTIREEESLYLLAQSYYGMKDYEMATQYFKQYYTSFPKGEYNELARFYSGYGLFLDSADPRLDQSTTYQALQELQLFLEYYPQSERAKQAQQMMFDLQEKLAYKELLAVRLYYNLGNYMGNNYQSAIITAQNALKDYPYSVYREDLMYLLISSRYQLAIESVDEKLQSRYRDVVDEYYSYINEFPEGKYLKQVQKYFDYANKHIRVNY